MRSRRIADENWQIGRCWIIDSADSVEQLIKMICEFFFPKLRIFFLTFFSPWFIKLIQQKLQIKNLKPLHKVNILLLITFNSFTLRNEKKLKWTNFKMFKCLTWCKREFLSLKSKLFQPNKLAYMLLDDLIMRPFGVLLFGRKLFN